MADVFRPTYKKTLPKGETIHKEEVDGQWKHYIKLKDSRGREIKGYLTEDGTGYLHPQKNWAGYYKDYNGKRRKISLCTDKGSSQSAINCLMDLIGKLRAGRSAPPLSEIPPLIHKAAKEALVAGGQVTKLDTLSRKPINEHVTAYLAHLECKRSTKKHIKECKRYLNTVIEACCFKKITDIALTPIEDFINTKNAENASARTINCYVDRIRYFLAWAKDRHIVGTNSLAQWTRLNEKANRVREARSLTEDEIVRLLDATLRRPLAQRLNQGHKLKSATRLKLQRLGEARRLIYSIMLYTGLRVKETRQLKWSDVKRRYTQTLTASPRKYYKKL